ncbi:MAG: hypothetical protein J7L26_01040 [Candidatus Aminicenantes bacterium]|nr:hypothetical protein [Candidatus Aminicenantes bacterium]
MSMNQPEIKNSYRFERGSATLLCIFVFILLATLGLGALINTQVFLQSHQYRRNQWLRELAAENGVKWVLPSLRKYFDEIYPFLFLGENKVGFNFLSKAPFPPEQMEDLLGPLPIPQDDQSFRFFGWKSKIVSRLDSFYKSQHYWVADYELVVEGKGYQGSLSSDSSAQLSFQVRLGCGRLPLAWFPFLYQGEPSSREAEEIEKKINLFSRETSIFKPRKIILPPDKLATKEPQEWLAENLKIGVLEPEDFSRSRFREILGLEPANEAIPPGVYLIRDDLGLGGLFIQGDVEELLLGIDSSYQIIQVKKESSYWQLRFSPAQKITEFQTPQGLESFTLLPRGMVIINGSVQALGAGVITPEKKLLPTQEKIPCFLQGITLTFLCAEEITITSHLYQEGLNLEEHIPYLKGQESQLIIWACGQELFSGEKTSGKIHLQSPEDQELLIQAHLKTVSLNTTNNPRKLSTVNLMGSLQTDQLNLKSSSLNIFHQPPRINDSLGEAFPLTQQPLLALLLLQPQEWKEGNYD